MNETEIEKTQEDFKQFITAIRENNEDILKFANDHSQGAARDAIYHGAFSRGVFGNFTPLNYVHPTLEVEDITPRWIINAYINAYT